MMSDTKSRELTLHRDDGYKFRIEKVVGNDELGPCFSLKTTLQNGAGDWGVYIPGLRVDTMYGVRMVGPLLGTHEYKLISLDQNAQAETSRAVAAETKLQQNIDSETASRVATDNYHTAQIAQEISDRQTGDFQLDIKLNSEVSRAQASELVLTNNVAGVSAGLATEVSERKSEVVRLDARILQEIQTRGDSVFNEAQLREAADVKLGARCDGLVSSVAAEVAERKSEFTRVDGRIDFITSNSDPAALDSLSEIVAQFSQNGQGFASRLAWLEGVVADLVSKTQ
jgi:hypothetical protein